MGGSVRARHEERWTSTSRSSSTRRFCAKPRSIQSAWQHRSLEEPWSVPRVPGETSISDSFFCRLKRESRAEIDLQEVVLGPVNDIPSGFGEYPNMGSKAILEPSTKITQHLVTKAQASIQAYPIVPRE